MELTFTNADQVFAAALWAATNCRRKIDFTLVSGLTYKVTGQEDDVQKLVEVWSA